MRGHRLPGGAATRGVRCLAAIALLLGWLPGLARAAQITRDVRLTILPAGGPIAEAGFDENVGRWHVGLLQQHQEIGPQNNLPGFSLEGSFLSIGVLRSLGFVAGPDNPASRWNRMAVDGGAVVGFLYGTTHAGGNNVHGLAGALRGRFALQLLREPATAAERWNALTGFFGIGVAYSLATVTGSGPNFDVGTSITHGDVGLQAELTLNSAWEVEPFVVGSTGWQNTAVHQGGTVTGRERYFYRVDAGAEFKLHISAERAADELGFQGQVTYSDTTGWGVAVGVVLRRGF